MKCSACGQDKHFSKFTVRKDRPSGRVSRCKVCIALTARARRLEKPETRRRWQRNYAARRPMRLMLGSARRRAAKRGLRYSITAADEAKLEKRLRRGVCELTGIPLRIGGGLTYDSPSLDRRDPRKGYTYENVRIILFGLNAAMGNWGERVLLQILQKYLMKKRRNR